jgi:hypothetical protein
MESTYDLEGPISSLSYDGSLNTLLCMVSKKFFMFLKYSKNDKEVKSPYKSIKVCDQQKFRIDSNDHPKNSS